MVDFIKNEPVDYASGEILIIIIELTSGDTHINFIKKIFLIKLV